MPDLEFDPTLPADELDKKTDAEAEVAPVKGEGEGEGEAAEFSADAEAEGDAAQPEAEEPVADAPAADASEDGAEPQVAPDAEEVSAQADAEAAESAAEDDAEQEAAPVADDGNVVHPEAIQAPLAEASSIAPALPSDSTGPATAEAGEAEGDEAQQPAPATPAPLDTIRAEGQGAAEGDADPSAGIVPQPKAEDAIAERPLSGIASEENRGAVDAMPAAAQQHMGQWVKGVHEAEPAEAGQLPTTSDLPGTPMDATGVGTYAKGGVTQADKALEAKAEDGDEAAQESVDNGGGSGTPAEAGDDADSDSDADAELSDDGFEGDDSLDTGEGSEDQGGGDGCYFGDAQVQHGPLVDVAGDAIDALKQAAEQAALAQNHFQNVPLAVLDVQHKDMLVDVRVVLGDLLRLAARLFERIER